MKDDEFWDTWANTMCIWRIRTWNNRLQATSYVLSTWIQSKSRPLAGHKEGYLEPKWNVIIWDWFLENTWKHCKFDSIKREKCSVTNQENLELAALIFHHRDATLIEKSWKHGNTQFICLQAKRLKDGYNDPDVLLKVNKADKTGIMKAIKAYLRSLHVSDSLILLCH